ncbi:MAG TPA: hypothetical protein DDW98_08885 [Gammaproteobacteria bacterium]|jgi:hypothetical protein|nr:hypothetical protein [Gammaproteobacteria bacterium]
MLLALALVSVLGWAELLRPTPTETVLQSVYASLRAWTASLAMLIELYFAAKSHGRQWDNPRWRRVKWREDRKR